MISLGALLVKPEMLRLELDCCRVDKDIKGPAGVVEAWEGVNVDELEDVEV